MTRSGKIVPLDNASRAAFDNTIKDFAKKGLRTLAMCYKDNCGSLKDYNGPNHPSHALL